ncbi:glucose-6-phosphate/phosphate and phosphoenolpyruvate/phosphate antiporter [Aspergillus heteromorphus CBS 117.55]|uniref:Glucose-6-phosphate/phosphate and phosphoenolpyruvate/phosphate antiporter n=1 Tax=Aspergillus heteromorphus CBS 117.55 TaxID=1448321 RepID=A0A317W2X2_9EURO|nr:glucose-6-phosphate/phosphate and phosphoenolpyruvate/phosphate antiporter [Aspergillus heteromorphus CBS 117.55]PWY79538.1 glucose-6-phosphate/phosphate and phosphoenolpyruvate/phosphate antiporter [Aspergillus heteromorphus CBS 117.55]
MTTTFVIGTGRRSSIRLSDLQAPAAASISHQMTSPIDKFPPFHDGLYETTTESREEHPISSIGYTPTDYWESRTPAQLPRDLKNGGVPLNSKRGPRKSISEAISTIRTRNASVSANAQELADALRAPVSYKLIILCLVWYMTSALTNTSSKSILNALPKPITLTVVQFAFVALWCLVLSYLSATLPWLRESIPALKHGIRPPSRDVVRTALPLAVFQLAGHILSSMATSQIPVSLVHTIKGLSPLFTVLAYRVFFRIRYAKATYLSLVPLTLGVMLACSTGFSTNLFGILCALVAAIVFVSQNIFSKKLFNEASRAESDSELSGRQKLDKLNLLYYCSGLAFILTLPIWFVCEGYPLISDLMQDGSISLSGNQGSMDHGALFLEFVFNGISHFAQNILAFVLLSMISPVSYSVASLVKRVFVIVVAIIWFGSSTTLVQGFGIILTCIGLYLYDRNSHDDVADLRANADNFRARETILPLSTQATGKTWNLNGYASSANKFPLYHTLDGSSLQMKDPKKDDGEQGHVRPRGSSNSRVWLPPGTKQETTWQPNDS